MHDNKKGKVENLENKVRYNNNILIAKFSLIEQTQRVISQYKNY